MDRRDLFRRLLTLPFASIFGLSSDLSVAIQPIRRVRPADPRWPSASQWNLLKLEVGGRLLKLQSPFERCVSSPAGDRCGEALRQLRNPYFIGDEPALTQASGWVDAWTSQPSAYAVAAVSTADVAAAVNFARRRNLRLVVKGGGHGYQGTSTAPDSLLIWTRRMNSVALQDDFVPYGCQGKQAPQPAVSLRRPLPVQDHPAGRGHVSLGRHRRSGRGDRRSVLRELSRRRHRL